MNSSARALPNTRRVELGFVNSSALHRWNACLSLGTPGVEIANSVDGLKDYPGIDIRGDGGYVVGPGSTIRDQAYEIV